jgi:hypothetical protein
MFDARSISMHPATRIQMTGKGNLLTRTWGRDLPSVPEVPAHGRGGCSGAAVASSALDSGTAAEPCSASDSESESEP